MPVLHIIWDVCFILLGIILIIFSISGDLEAYWALICLALMGWAVWDLRKQIREIRKRGELDQMEKERDEIRERMEKKEE